MSAGRVLAALTASAAVGGCAVVAFSMTNAVSEPDAAPRTTVVAAPTSRPAFIPVAGTHTPTAEVATARPVTPTTHSPVARTVAPVAVPLPTATPVTTVAPQVVPATRAAAAHPVPLVTPVAKPAAKPVAKPAPRKAAPVTHVAAKPAGRRLPLTYSTGSATRVVTVTAHSHGSTTATLQAWTKVSGGWKKYGTAVTAHVGAQGIGKASESSSHTPAGTFTLTQAFGRKSDPGTALPYFRTTPSDYWISDSGSRYNTHQRCASCGYNDGRNERLYYETPYYNYAVVIDYNTRNAPGGVHAGKGSAFFLHVTDGKPTAGCVAIPQSRLVPLMKWLAPSAHPRILIGVV